MSGSVVLYALLLAAALTIWVTAVCSLLETGSGLALLTATKANRHKHHTPRILSWLVLDTRADGTVSEFPCCLCHSKREDNTTADHTTSFESNACIKRNMSWCGTTYACGTVVQLLE